MSEIINMQEAILKECHRKKLNVTLFLMNGVPVRGTIIGYDNFVVVMKSEGSQKMVYKHAISTVVPGVPLDCLNK